MTTSTVPHTTGADATVNAPTLETLYDPDGVPITVPANAVDKFLRLGYTREHQDIPTLLSEVQALSVALAAPWQAYVAACQDGTIDNAAQDTARVALDLLADACNRLHLAIHRSAAPAQKEV